MIQEINIHSFRIQVDRVIFTVFLEEDKEVYEELMQKYFPIQ